MILSKNQQVSWYLLISGDKHDCHSCMCDVPVKVLKKQLFFIKEISKSFYSPLLSIPHVCYSSIPSFHLSTTTRFSSFLSPGYSRYSEILGPELVTRKVTGAECFYKLRSRKKEKMRKENYPRSEPSLSLECRGPLTSPFYSFPSCTCILFPLNVWYRCSRRFCQRLLTSAVGVTYSEHPRYFVSMVFRVETFTSSNIRTGEVYANSSWAKFRDPVSLGIVMHR